MVYLLWFAHEGLLKQPGAEQREGSRLAVCFCRVQTRTLKHRGTLQNIPFGEGTNWTETTRMQC